MEYIIEAILDLILDGSMEISSNKKISKWIRYTLILFIILFFSIVIIGLFILGLMILKENILFGFFIIILSLFMLIGSIVKFKKIYGKKVEDKNI